MAKKNKKAKTPSKSKKATKKPKKKAKKTAAGAKSKKRISKKPRASGRVSSGLLSTGSKGLNDLIGGGIKRGSAILVHGTPHCGKKPVLMKIGYTNFAKNTPVIFVLTDFGVVSWERMMASSRWYAKKHSKKVYYVDIYSTQFAACPVGENITCVPVPYSLGRISIEVSNFIDKITEKTKIKPVVIFHSLSTLLQNFDEDDVFKFMQFFIGKLRTNGVTSIFSMQQGIHEDHTADIHRSLMDGILEMTDGNVRAIGFGRIKTTAWCSCEIKGSDIIVTPKKEGEE